MQSKLRQTIPEANAGRKMSPREIQSQIRSGMSAQDVSNLTGVPLDYISRFEGPVLAEREFVVTSALNVAVHTAIDADPFTQGMTFGSAIRHKLVSLHAVNERWASWKEEGSGWVVKLSFTADHIDHDARWSFEPKKNSLAPLNNEAVALSQQGDLPGSLIPRLRAVSGNQAESDDEVEVESRGGSRRDAQAEAQPGNVDGNGNGNGNNQRSVDPAEPDASRFDSGAFDLAKHDIEHPDAAIREAVLSRFAPAGNSTPKTGAVGASNSAGNTVSANSVSANTASTGATATGTASNQTADLLEALRRRRGERESANYREDEELVSGGDSATTPQAPTGIRLVDVPLEKYLANEPSTKATAPQPTTPAKTGRKGRTAMPSWDDIVFGARPDDLP
jgi:hypothetical protein